MSIVHEKMILKQILNYRAKGREEQEDLEKAAVNEPEQTMAQSPCTETTTMLPLKIDLNLFSKTAYVMSAVIGR